MKTKSDEVFLKYANAFMALAIMTSAAFFLVVAPLRESCAARRKADIDRAYWELTTPPDEKRAAAVRKELAAFFPLSKDDEDFFVGWQRGLDSLADENGVDRVWLPEKLREALHKIKKCTLCRDRINDLHVVVEPGKSELRLKMTCSHGSSSVTLSLGL